MEIDQNEVLRYLGYRGNPADAETLARIADCAAELGAAVSPHSVVRIFLVIHGDGAVNVGGLEIRSRDLRGHLDGCREAALFAATLGPQADILLRRASKTDMSRAVLLQACAAAMTESYCDLRCDELAEEVRPRGLYLRPRYSPGYGDFDIRHQPDLLRMLDCEKKIGLTATDGSMLAPSKSVTAVIGLTEDPKSCHIAKCMDCKSVNCPFRTCSHKGETP